MEDRTKHFLSCKFIRIEAEVVNNPITCIKSSVNSQSNFKPRSQQSQGSYSSNFGTRSYQPQSQPSHRAYSHAAKTPNSGQRPVACVFCNGSYVVTSCDNFSVLSLDEKHNFIRSRRLCFGCHLVWPL